MKKQGKKAMGIKKKITKAVVPHAAALNTSSKTDFPEWAKNKHTKPHKLKLTKMSDQPTRGMLSMHPKG